MDQMKIGIFLKKLRKENDLTQEQLAEKLNVARRTVSRWETGSNLPDLDILIELSDLYDVDLRELLNGERTEQRMDKELKETVLQVADYSNEEKRKSTKIVLAYFVIGIIALIINVVINYLQLEKTSLIRFIEGATIGFALIAMLLGILYTTGKMETIKASKARMEKRGRLSE